MDENRQIALLMAITLLLGLGGIGLMASLTTLTQGDLIWDRYDGSLSVNGGYIETITARVLSEDRYHMLYRYWNDPLSFTSLETPYLYLEGLEAPSGRYAYAKDYQGTVRIFSPGGDPFVPEISRLAFENEVGAYSPEYYPPGIYPISAHYVLHPPVQYDAETSHLNVLFLRGDHPAIHRVEIRIFAEYVERVYPHPPTLSVQREGEQYLVSGSLGKDELLEIELLLSPAYVEVSGGFPIETADVRGQTERANLLYGLPYQAGILLTYAGSILVIAIPFLLLFVYRRYGQEKESTVPTMLSFVPNPDLPPWQVNLLFKKDALDFDEDGFYATLLDLHRRKKIEMTEKEGQQGFSIRILEKTSEDPYERRILTLLHNMGEDDLVDTERLKERAIEARNNPTQARELMQYQASLGGVMHEVDRSIAYQYIVDGRSVVLPLLFIGAIPAAVSVLIAVLSPLATAAVLPGVILYVISMVQVGVAAAFPSTLFGHWKGDAFREKQEWDAFRRFLSDLALIRQYAPQDLSMWGEWLVYGTGPRCRG
jgi:Predicted membrane protein (DUF2207).